MRWVVPTMEFSNKPFVYHCFDRIVIFGSLWPIDRAMIRAR
jgi:hypothetical protein